MKPLPLIILLVALSLFSSMTACARVPIPTSDQTATLTPSLTRTTASPPITATVASSQTAFPTSSPRAIPLPNETVLGMSAARVPTAASVSGKPAPVLTPVAYERNARAILVEADISGGLASAPREAHVPLFRLYADGFVVFAGEQTSLSTGLDAIVMTGNLDERAVQELLALVREAGFYGLEPFYQAKPAPVDVPTARITVNLDKAKTVQVYAPGLRSTPAAFFDAFGYIARTKPENTSVFTPREGYLVAVAAGAVTDFRSKDVLAEWPSSIGVRLADATDGTAVSGSTYSNAVSLVAQTYPNTLYREGDRVYRVAFSPELPRGVHQTDWVGTILQAPREFEGRAFDIVGYYRGANLLGEASASPSVSKSDWVIADATGAIYVTGAQPSGLSPQSRGDIWSLVHVRGVVVYVRLGTSYLEARKVEVLARNTPVRTSTPAATATLAAAVPVTTSVASTATAMATGARTLAATPARTLAVPGYPALPTVTVTLSMTAAPAAPRLVTKAPVNK